MKINRILKNEAEISASFLVTRTDAFYLLIFADLD